MYTKYGQNQWNPQKSNPPICYTSFHLPNGLHPLLPVFWFLRLIEPGFYSRPYVLTVLSLQAPPLNNSFCIFSLQWLIACIVFVFQDTYYSFFSAPHKSATHVTVVAVRSGESVLRHQIHVNRRKSEEREFQFAFSMSLSAFAEDLSKSRFSTLCSTLCAFKRVMKFHPPFLSHCDIESHAFEKYDSPKKSFNPALLKYELLVISVY